MDNITNSLASLKRAMSPSAIKKFFKGRLRDNKGKSVFGFQNPRQEEDKERLETYTARIMEGHRLSPEELEDFQRVQMQDAVVMGSMIGMSAPVSAGARAVPKFVQTSANTLTRSPMPLMKSVPQSLPRGVMPRFVKGGQFGDQLFRDPRQLAAIKRALAEQGVRFAI